MRDESHQAVSDQLNDCRLGVMMDHSLPSSTSNVVNTHHRAKMTRLCHCTSLSQIFEMCPALLVLMSGMNVLKRWQIFSCYSQKAQNLEQSGICHYLSLHVIISCTTLSVFVKFSTVCALRIMFVLCQMCPFNTLGLFHFMSM